MNRNFAFRLCGELAKTGSNLSYGVSTGNLAMTCINAGIELIDMTSSIISWGSERNRTKIMQESLNETVKNYERLKEQDRRRVNLVIEQEKDASRYRLERLRIELEKERSLLMNQIEQLSREENSKAELLMRKSELTARIRIRVKNTIDLVSEMIGKETAVGDVDSVMLAELQERLRISVAQYTKFVNACC